MKYLGLILVLVVAASVATYVRYGSLHPCDWLVRDTARLLDLTPLMAEARVRGLFLLEGVADPDAGACVREWWRLRAQGAAAAP